MHTNPRLGRRVAAAIVVGALLSVAACSDDPPTASSTDDSAGGQPVQPVIDPGDGGDYAPDIDPADFVATIDNPYLPLIPGARWVYEDTSAHEVERVEVEVLDETRTVMGIDATVVRDTVTVDGVVVEDTYDWFAQDAEGSVWYLGEDVSNYEDGQLVDHDGSFEAGVDGALPGIVMLADPQVGDAYRQEYYVGEAEDLGEVLRLGEARSVPAGSFEDVLVTQDWNPLEPDVVEQKYYAPGVGLIYEEKVQGEAGQVALVEHTPAP